MKFEGKVKLNLEQLAVKTSARRTNSNQTKNTLGNLGNEKTNVNRVSTDN